MASEKITFHQIANPTFGRNTISDISISSPLGILFQGGQIGVLYREFLRDSPEEELPIAPRDVWILRPGDAVPDASGVRLEAALSVPGAVFGESGSLAIYCVECNPI
jgi:hypothetical protein